ncbi:protein mono-ADP-ribosyltransferase PARP14-like [Melanotaenia boesemani]|uniref:protein mono-ADP-ribosyltransferase PARP14-like n=1 Tax=Melanotaenia boesemani TaxID=1250792 RepID=UPI001C04DBFD|nr:protein mono-ADP-ribosyltransferase PARP14-like [Melanotaenia boesemani]
MDEYQYPLFFEARDLTDREKEKVRRHFQKRRDSGGGDCAIIEKIGDKTYKICFRESETQERVLQRKNHTISLPGGELCLTVSRTILPQASDQPATSQPQTLTKGNTKGLEKVFKIDIFLMYYMRDNPKIFKILHKQLSSIGCTLELDFDEEEAVVRGDIEKGPGGAFGGAAEKWELQVDQIFISFTETYICYHVFEAKKIKKMLQDRSFLTDDMKVYTESGYAVVVGEAEDVKKKIAILDKSLPACMKLPVVENQFKLVEEEFNGEMATLYPEVKITRDSAMIVLEGPDQKVQSGATKLNELVKKIKEKKVQLPSHLLTFIRTSGAITKYQLRFQQSLRNPVSLEVTSDLVLSSLSSVSLEEVAAAVLRELRVADVELQGTAGAAPDLNQVKEILIKAKNQANLVEHRVDVSFIPGPSGAPVTKVRLVGYTEHVNKLKELLHDYLMNQVSTQEVLDLPHPELVDCFDKILNIIGMKQTNVTLRASHLPYPCILMSGPRCQVQETRQALTSTLASLTLETLVLDGPGALRYFQGDGKDNKELVETSCQVLIKEKVQIKPRARSRSISSIRPTFSINRPRFSTVGNIADNGINLKIKIGSLENEQVNVLVVPMLKKQLTSTNIGASLLSKGGNTLKSKFDLVVANCTLAPGGVLQVDGPPSLGCSKIFFIECLPWDGVRGNSVQALSNGLKRCLDLCVQLKFSSVAIPVIGPGVVLNYPLTEAVQVLVENIHQFGQTASSGSLSTIHIVIKPGYPNSEECYHEVYKRLSLNRNQGGQVIFKSLTSDLDDVTMTVGGGVKLQVVFGDITNENTDAVVNTTDFTNFHNDGVCKDILTIAGPDVEAKLKAAKVNRGNVFVSQPGLFPCKAILHVCGEKDASVIEGLVHKIIDHCENSGFRSVAIPAICAGSGGLEPSVVAGAIVRGIKDATFNLLSSLTDIRLVLIKINVFLAFKEETTQMFPMFLTVTNRVSVLQPPPPSLNTDLSLFHTSSANQNSTFLFLGLCRKDVDDAMQKLETQYNKQCSTHTFEKEELEGLTQDDFRDLNELVEIEGLYMQKHPSGSLTVNGLKDGVKQVIVMIKECMHDNLRREVRVREEEDLFTRVMWCILGHNGNWERLPKMANYNLEKQDIAAGIVDTQGVSWQVDLQAMKATTRPTRQKTRLKRLENQPDFTLPLYWDNMATSEPTKVLLQSSSAEYRTIKEAFKRTAPKTVMKIERLQNIHLRRAYEAQKKHISEKNKLERAREGEKLLYHGTTEENCDAIMKTGFNRRFAGQNATVYGYGTYFAVNASYSANPTYSKPTADGSQLMFVARVLTGVYTQGSSTMSVPPARNSQQSHDRYDSVVDKMDNPNMFVVFHDDQAYPDYLITFK